MVLQVGLAKFYGSSLPRPRIYEDVKYNAERVDPPTPPTAPLLSWAREVRWSMGGLSSKRKRSQGKIEGNLKKLRDLEDDDDDGGGEVGDNVGEDPHCKDSNPSSPDSLPANEGLTKSEEGCSREALPGTRTRAENLKKVVSSSCEGSDAVSRRASPTRSKGRKKQRKNRG